MTRVRAQGGATLLVTLIMLIMLTLFAISAMNTGTINLKMVGNMQNKREAMDATQAVIERVLSRRDFISTPTNALASPCGGAPNTACTDLNGDGTPELTTVLSPAPVCMQARALKVSELVITPNSEDLACTTQQGQGTFAVAGAAPTGDSLCAQTVWEITAVTRTYGSTVLNSDVNVTTSQGVGVRIPALDMTTNCP
jgi:Tfp pilus assembly protein PilX